MSVRDVEMPGRLHCPRLEVRPGEHLLISGANGSGKSTLLSVIAGLVRPDSGTVGVWAREVGWLAQEVSIPDLDASAAQLYERVPARTPLAAPELAIHARPATRWLSDFEPLGEKSYRDPLMTHGAVVSIHPLAALAGTRPA